MQKNTSIPNLFYDTPRGTEQIGLHPINYLSLSATLDTENTDK